MQLEEPLAEDIAEESLLQSIEVPSPEPEQVAASEPQQVMETDVLTSVGISREVLPFESIAKEVVQPMLPHLPETAQAAVHENAVLVLLAVSTGLFLIIIGILRAILLSFKRKRVVLCGPMQSGKTTLLHALKGQPLPHGSVTSMAVNSAPVTLPGTGKVLEVVDVPGHPRLSSLLDAHMRPGAAAVVFLLDSVTFLANKHSVAEHLYQVLQRVARAPGHPPLLVACNKADQSERAFGQDFTARQLEKEINGFRASRLAEVPGVASSQDGLGAADGAFTFAGSPVATHFCSISALDGSLDDLMPLLQKL